MKRKGLLGLLDVPFNLLGRLLDWANDADSKPKACHGVQPKT